MRFWRLDSPDYKNDYEHTYINGELDHTYGLPGVKCELCGETWGGMSIMPYELPQSLRSLPSLKHGAPISAKAHADLRTKVLDALRAEGTPVDRVSVGATFQPGYLDVPSNPEADFLWCSIGSVVVSQRVQEILQRARVTGGVFVPVIPRKIGKRKAKARIPLPRTGEPEDLIAETNRVVDPAAARSYFEFVITANSKNPPGVDPVSRCVLCERESFDKKARKLVMEPAMWNGEDIFFLATTLWIIVTERVKELLELSRVTNVKFVQTTDAA